MPRIMPDARYFSMPSTVLGADVRRKRALNCWPWVRSFTHSPDAVIHSPAAIVAACPTTVTRSRCPRTFARRTQNPFSALWKVTRSTRPASTSWVDDTGCGFIRIDASSIFAAALKVGGRLRDAEANLAKLILWVMLSIASFSRKGCGCANVLPTVASISYISKDSIPMTVSMYQASAPIFVQFLTSLSTVLDKAAAHAEAKKIDPAVLLNTRLYPDMFPLARQVREATNHAASACGHVAGVDLPTLTGITYDRRREVRN